MQTAEVTSSHNHMDQVMRTLLDSDFFLGGPSSKLLLPLSALSCYFASAWTLKDSSGANMALRN